MRRLSASFASSTLIRALSTVVVEGSAVVANPLMIVVDRAFVVVDPSTVVVEPLTVVVEGSTPLVEGSTAIIEEAMLAAACPDNASATAGHATSGATKRPEALAMWNIAMNVSPHGLASGASP